MNETDLLQKIMEHSGEVRRNLVGANLSYEELLEIYDVISSEPHTPDKVIKFPTSSKGAEVSSVKGTFIGYYNGLEGYRDTEFEVAGIDMVISPIQARILHAATSCSISKCENISEALKEMITKILMAIVSKKSLWSITVEDKKSDLAHYQLEILEGIHEILTENGIKKPPPVDKPIVVKTQKAKK